MALVWEDEHTVALAPEKSITCRSIPDESAANSGQISVDEPDAFPNPVGAFRADVKNEWVDAVFGPSFPHRTPQTISAREGVGLAGIKSYVAYGAVIPAREASTATSSTSTDQNGAVVAPAASAASPVENSSWPRVGVTLSRIPLGLYCRAVDVAGEAFSAGVVPGSVLVDINGLSVLAEPSHKLLERLWQYEGNAVFSGGTGMVDGDDSSITGESPDGTTLVTVESGPNRGNSGSSQHSTFGGVQSPVALRFIRSGRTYTALLLSKAPFGIVWAPCGNFALVQTLRAHSVAEAAGVRRGCLVASVNGKSLRDMDHIETAEELKQLFTSGEQITLTLAFTPAASRTGGQGRGAKANKDEGGKTVAIKERDGVKVKRKTSSVEGPRSSHPLEGFLLNCGTGREYMPESAESRRPDAKGSADPISDLASQVATGTVFAPSGFGKRGTISTSVSRSGESKYSNCPAFRQIVLRWNALESLVFCILFHLAGFNEDKFHRMGGIIGVPACEVMQTPSENAPTAMHSPAAFVAMLQRAASAHGAEEVFGWYLIQIISLLSSRDFVAALQNETYSTENDTDDGACLGHKAPTSAELDEARLLGGNIVKLLLDLAVGNPDLCQRLNFLLSSFLASAEGHTSSDADSEGTAIDGGGYSSKQTLQNAQQQLSSRLRDQELSDQTSREKGCGAMESQRNRSDRNSEIERLSNKKLQATIKSLDREIMTGVSPKKKKKAVTKKFGRLLLTGSMKKRAPLSNPASVVGGPAKQDEAVNDTDITTSPSASSEKSSDWCQSAPVSTRSLSLSTLFDNMAWFLGELEATCNAIERSLLKSVSQKIAEWALQPWSETKDITLANVTSEMRKELQRINFGRLDGDGKMAKLPLLNPVDSSELLLSVEPEESYILPSAHFPLLLCFSSCPFDPHPTTSEKGSDGMAFTSSPIPQKTAQIGGRDVLYRVTVEVVALHSSGSDGITCRPNGNSRKMQNCAYVLHAALAGAIQETSKSTSSLPGTSSYRWKEGNVLKFETRSSWGSPNTLSVRLSSIAVTDEGVEKLLHSDDEGRLHYSIDAGYCWVDLSTIWDRIGPSNGKDTTPSQATVTCHAQMSSFRGEDEFDHSGYPTHSAKHSSQKMEVELKVTTECVPLGGDICHRRMLLYKHDDDMRQEMVALEYIEACDRILRASGLDLKLRTFRCLTVGDKKGFIEWVTGTVPLSEICAVGSTAMLDVAQSGSGSGSGLAAARSERSVEDSDPYPVPRTLGQWCKYESLRGLKSGEKTSKPSGNNIYNKNPVQDFLRASAYDADAPYFIRKDVMDRYVKSCAGYSIITYLLGVGDRHLDNLLLHPDGYFLHCDYSFILGQDPKTYLPMRITEDMVLGMGGRESDNFAKFLSLAGAAFVALRRHNNVRLLMSLVRNVAFAELPDVSKNQSPEDALMSMRYRFRLDLSENAALSFIERLIESSIVSKIWIAVDAIHQLGKRF